MRDVRSELPMSAITQPVEREILEAVRGIKYGSVEVVIHDSRVVQVVRTEKVRLEATGQATDGRSR
jgi:hypothetical protein